MRTIEISTDVYAAIWSRRERGQDSENAILEAVLGVEPLFSAERPAETGAYDQRHGITFPAGFRVFRKYKGEHFEAYAKDGHWVMAGKRYRSLNELSSALGATENAWMAWLHDGPTGKPEKLAFLRKPNFSRAAGAVA